MASVKLSTALIREATIIKGSGKSKESYYDKEVPGLVFEVLSSGRKSFFFRYRDHRGKIRQPKICNANELSLKEVRTLVLRYRGELALGIDPFEEKRERKAVPLLEDFVYQRYLPYIQTYKRSWKTDECNLRNHIIPMFGRRYLDEIKSGDIHVLVGKQLEKYKPGSINRLIILLRYIFNLALKWEVEGVSENPVAGIPLLEENNKRERFLRKEEVVKLMHALELSENRDLKNIVMMLLLTGARKNEVLTARWQDIEIDKRFWRIPVSKSGKARYVPLSDQMIALLNDIVPEAEGEFLFANPATGKPYTTFYNSWDRARKLAGLKDVRVHDLRHSFASFLVNGGRSLYEVQKILGHSQIKTTQRYAHLSNESLVDAANEVSRQITIF